LHEKGGEGIGEDKSLNKVLPRLSGHEKLKEFKKRRRAEMATIERVILRHVGETHGR
jgi:hypothetical protein